MAEKERRFSPALYQYLKKFQEDPTSRIFAPLAESYRKAGLIEEAIEIAREGLKTHPNFVGGRVALARALFEKQAYEDVLLELKPIIEDVPDNLVAQRLIAESNLMLGRLLDALNSYKMLLYFSPGDKETGKIVQELETQAYQKGLLALRNDPPDSSEMFIVGNAGFAISDDPEVKRKKWVTKIEKLQSILQKIERYRARVTSLA